MTSDTEIHPFEIAIPDEELDDLRSRLSSARWPAELARKTDRIDAWVLAERSRRDGVGQSGEAGKRGQLAVPG